MKFLFLNIIKSRFFRILQKTIKNALKVKVFLEYNWNATNSFTVPYSTLHFSNTAVFDHKYPSHGISQSSSLEIGKKMSKMKLPTV